jgi:hypothetical protein
VYKKEAMDYDYLRNQLEENGTIIEMLVMTISVEQSRWKPDPERWSILEVINHLYDEEREDFRLHLDIMLHRPDGDWPPIDPMNWITTRKYNERDIQESIANFMTERKKSLAWLDLIDNPDWESSVEAPWGLFKAGDMFASWIAHDQWHIQQLVRIRLDYTTKISDPYSVQYAGTL